MNNKRSQRMCRPYWLGCIALALALGGCQTTAKKETVSAIDRAMHESSGQAARSAPPAPPPEVSAALLPPLNLQLPAGARPVLEQRFDVSVNNAPAREFFMSLVEDTAVNLVVHPSVEGEISLTLQNVTIEEVLNTVQDVYGYQFRKSRTGYQIYPARMRSRIFQVNYLNVSRKGRSKTRVNSGEVSQRRSGGSDDGNKNGSTSRSNGEHQNQSATGTEVRTESDANFWTDLKSALELIVGEEGGRSVVVNPHAGVVLVRAMPGELRDVEEFLDTIERVAHRQVLLEAKILEVTLRDGFQAGINWAGIIGQGGDYEIIAGQATSTLAKATISEFQDTDSPINSEFEPFDVASGFGGIFTINARLNDFVALINFLTTQGDVHVLSSPRVATVNNQKAVIKVGNDEFFVTDVDTDTDTTDAGINQSVDIELTPFFSGVALDVIPQIDDNDEIILHIHPTVSEVDEQNKQIAITTDESLTIPLAFSTVRESDTIIRARSGQVVVIGGLMEDITRDEGAKTPLLGDLPGVGALFRQTREQSRKTELVILLRPVVARDNGVWAGDLARTAQRFRQMQADPGETEPHDALAPTPPEPNPKD